MPSNDQIVRKLKSVSGSAANVVQEYERQAKQALDSLAKEELRQLDSLGRQYDQALSEFDGMKSVARQKSGLFSPHTAKSGVAKAAERFRPPSRR